MNHTTNNNAGANDLANLPPNLRAVALMIDQLCIIERISTDERARGAATGTLDEVTKLLPPFADMVTRLREKYQTLPTGA